MFPSSDARAICEPQRPAGGGQVVLHSGRVSERPDPLVCKETGSDIFN